MESRLPASRRIFVHFLVLCMACAAALLAPSQAFAAAAHVFEHIFRTPQVMHTPLEPMVSAAEAGEEGTVLVNSSTQHPSEIQAIVAEVLDITVPGGVRREDYIRRVVQMRRGEPVRNGLFRLVVREVPCE